MADVELAGGQGTAGRAAAAAGGERAHARAVTVLRAIIAFTVLSTVIHYTHNFVEVDQYPQGSGPSNDLVRLGVVTVWPLLTIVGLLGHRLYVQRRFRPAHVALAIYSLIGWLTLGHFTAGEKIDIPAFFYATIFTDAIAAAALVAFVLWSERANRPAA